LVDHTEEDVFDAGAFGSGTIITLWKDDSNQEFGATVGDDNSDSCVNSNAIKVCEGKSAPNYDSSNTAATSKPLFYTVCGSSDMKYVSFDPYVNSDDKVTDPGVVASYKCKTSPGDTAHTGRPTWKLLGYFIDDGSCDDLIGKVGYSYESDFCPLPTDAPLSSPTDTPTTVPTAVPTALPTAAPIPAPTYAPTAVPTAVPTAAPNAASTVAPTAAPVAQTASPIDVAPVSSPNPCSDDSSELFLLKIKNKSDNDGVKTAYGMVQSCAWLTSQDNKDEICRMKVYSHEGKAFLKGTNWRDSALPEEIYSPAQSVCKETCNSCDECYENPHSRFFKRIREGKPSKPFLTKCDQLFNLSESRKKKICKKTKTYRGYQPAAVECPITCSSYVSDSQCDHELITYAPTPAPPPPPNGIEYVGCYKDKVRDRALPVFKGKRKSIEQCATLCSDYTYFGLQSAYQCRCGNDDDDYGKHGPSMSCECNNDDNVGLRKNCVYRNLE